MLYRIADLTVKMDTFGKTASYAIPYMVRDGEADITVQANYDFVQEKYPHLPKEDWEYMATCSSFYLQLLSYGGLRLHSSAVILDGSAYLFSANSGVGKSTHTALWRCCFGDEHVRLINDDKPAVRKKNGVWHAYGTPWSGKHGLNLNLDAQIAGIAFIERAEVNSIERMSGIEAVMEIMKQTGKARDYGNRKIMMELLDQLLTEVPIWKLHCNMDPEAAIVAYEAMSGEKWRK